MHRMLALSVFLVTAVGVAGAADTAIEDFVGRHWRAPLPPQGPPPPRFTPAEAALTPQACGACHPAQLAEWRTSLHARAMGPGVAGQLVDMHKSAPADALGCYTCHAPLAEQRPLIGTGAARTKNPAYDPALAAQGLVCAACHVRAHERFGPPRRDGSLASAAPRESPPHGGVTRTPAFLASEFCRSCHQFEADGLAVNGKLLENTYVEWKQSRFAREGVQCQDCHMPERRHLWRGIHDREMVRSGVTITVSPEAPTAADGAVTATLRLESTRVGHAFPTYVIPRVILRGELLTPQRRPIPGSRRQVVIGRDVSLDLEQEMADTRLAPGEAAELVYRGRVTPGAVALRLSVIVEPDAFYARFFEALLRQGADEGAPQLREALRAARGSPYPLFVKEFRLIPPLPPAR